MLSDDKLFFLLHYYQKRLGDLQPLVRQLFRHQQGMPGSSRLSNLRPYFGWKLGGVATAAAAPGPGVREIDPAISLGMEDRR